MTDSTIWRGTIADADERWVVAEIRGEWANVIDLLHLHAVDASSGCSGCLGSAAEIRSWKPDTSRAGASVEVEVYKYSMVVAS